MKVYIVVAFNTGQNSVRKVFLYLADAKHWAWHHLVSGLTEWLQVTPTCWAAGSVEILEREIEGHPNEDAV